MWLLKGWTVTFYQRIKDGFIRKIVFELSREVSIHETSHAEGDSVNKALRQETLRCWQLPHRYIHFLLRENSLAQRNDCSIWHHMCQQQAEMFGWLEVERDESLGHYHSNYTNSSCLLRHLEADPHVVLWRLEGQHDAVNVMLRCYVSGICRGHGEKSVHPESRRNSH